MALNKETRWIYSKEDLEATPSRKDKIDADKELSYRQQAANLIQDMGQRLSVNQLTINTAIVYMHRFYVFHSFTVFSRYAIAPTALFVAAKVEEQPKKLEHVLKICHLCLHPDKPHMDTHGDAYLKQAQELVQNELILLQTLGFDISVDHPHTHVVKCTQLVKASRDLSQMAYFMATNSLHLTTFCLLYKPTVVAAMCIHLSCKWSNYEIPLSSDGKPYWAYMDSCITESLLDNIINEFLKILNRCPTRLRKLKNYRPSSKDGSDKDETIQNAPQIQPHKPTVQDQPQPDKQLTQPPPPVKEKKPSMSYEEYMNKRTNATKPPPQHSSNHHSTQHHPSAHGQVKKVENHAPTSQPSHPSSRSSHSLPHHNTVRHQVKDHPDTFSKSSHPQRKPPTDPHQNRRPPPHHHEHPQKNMMKPSDQHHARDKKIIKQERSRPVDHHAKPHQQPSASSQMVSKRNNTAESAEELALSKTLEGRIHSEKLLQQRGPASTHTKPVSHQPVSAGASQTGNNDPARRHHRGDGQTHGKEKRLDSRQIAEMYKKDPDKLRHYLKRNAQTQEEKHVLMKLQAKEEEKRRRKAAENQSMKNSSKPPAHHSIEKSSTARVESPGGGLMLRIKLPKPASGENGSSASVAKIVASSSGSDSQHSPVRSRKRGHGDILGHSAAKHSRRSEDHRKHGHPSESKHRQHSKPHTRPGKPSEPIDEAVFQKSLSDALSQVQQASSNVSATVKRPSNGTEALPFKSSSSRNHGFDPAIAVSAQLPDDIFEDDADQDGTDKNANSTSLCNPSQLSTPESGEIKDESPPYAKSSKFVSTAQKAPSLFSPPNSLDSQLIRSSSGYHSGPDTDFSPPVLLQKPYV